MSDVEDILALITCYDSAWQQLELLPRSTHHLHPEVTVKCIEHIGTLYVSKEEFLKLVPQDIWRHKCVCLAWLKHRGPLWKEIMPYIDREIALVLADLNWEGFQKLNKQLLSDRDFMLEAVQRDGRVLKFASEKLQQDIWVVAQAVANHKESLPLPRGMSEYEFQTSLLQTLKLRYIFIKEILRGIAISSQPTVPPALRSPLGLLDRGLETSLALKKLIAEYAGVPIGAQVNVLKIAQFSLRQAAPHISLKLKIPNGGILAFRIRRGTRLGKVFGCFANWANEDVGSFEFFFREQVLDPSLYPNFYFMPDDTLIHVRTKDPVVESAM
jgi:hypothetical protein